VYVFGFDCRHRVYNGCVEVDQSFLRVFWCVLCLQVLPDEVIVSVFMCVAVFILLSIYANRY
jgi:hypothetical protein